MKNKQIESDDYKNSDADSERQSSGQSSEDELRRFGERVTKVVGPAPVRAFAREAGIDEKSLRQYMHGQTEPSRKALIGIARAREISVEWLATGEGEWKRAADNKPLPANIDLLKEVISGVETYLEEVKKGMPADKKAELIAVLYEQFAAKGHVEIHAMERLLKLVA